MPSVPAPAARVQILSPCSLSAPRRRIETAPQRCTDQCAQWAAYQIAEGPSQSICSHQLMLHSLFVIGTLF